MSSSTNSYDNNTRKDKIRKKVQYQRVETLYVLDRNKIIENCCLKLASSRSFQSLTLNNYHNTAEPPKQQQLLGEKISQRLIEKLSSQHYSFQPMYVMEKDVLSQISFISDRMDMQGFYISPHHVLNPHKTSDSNNNSSGIGIGQYIKHLTNRLCHLSQEHMLELEEIDDNQKDSNTYPMLYLQLLLLLSRAPVQSMHQKLKHTKSLSSSPSQIQNYEYDDKEEEETSTVTTKEEDLNLAAWNQHFSEEVMQSPGYFKWKYHEYDGLEKKDDESDHVPTTDRSQEENEKRKGLQRDSMSSTTSTSSVTSSKSQKLRFGIPHETTLLKQYNKYGIEAIDQMENYILFHHASTNHDVSNQIAEQTNGTFSQHAKNMDQDLFMAHLYLSPPNALSYHLYPPSLSSTLSKCTTTTVATDKSKILNSASPIHHAPPQSPKAVAIISELELCRALASAFRGLPSSYFILIPPSTNSTTSSSSPSTDSYWTMQANTTNVWPITTSLSHEAVHSILAKALRQLADPISVVREFCQFNVMDGYSNGSYASSSRIYAAFQNGLQECILQPLERHVSIYEAQLYKVTVTSCDASDVGTLLSMTNTFTSRWSTSLKRAKTLIHGAFPLWRSWKCRKNSMDPQQYHQNNKDDHQRLNDEYAISSAACLDYLFTIVNEENLAESKHTSASCFEDSEVSNQSTPKEPVEADTNVFSSSSSSYVAFSLFTATVTAYCKLLEPWILEGKLFDPAGELFITQIDSVTQPKEPTLNIQYNDEGNHHAKNTNTIILENKDHLGWIQLEPLIVDSATQNHYSNNVFRIRRSQGAIPLFLRDLADDLFWCGIHIHLIRFGTYRSTMAIWTPSCAFHVGKHHDNKNISKHLCVGNLIQIHNQFIADGLSTLMVAKKYDDKIEISHVHGSKLPNKFSFISYVEPLEYSISKVNNVGSQANNENDQYCELLSDICHQNGSSLAYIKREHHFHPPQGLLDLLSADIRQNQIRASLSKSQSHRLYSMCQRDTDYAKSEEENTTVHPNNILNRTFHPTPRIESLLRSNFRIQCNAAGDELSRMLWNTGKHELHLCSSFDLRGHLDAIHMLYCMADSDFVSPFLSDLFSVLDGTCEDGLRAECDDNFHAFNNFELASTLYTSSGRLSSLLRLAIENKYPSIAENFTLGQRTDAVVYQTCVLKMLREARVQVTKQHTDSHQSGVPSVKTNSSIEEKVTYYSSNDLKTFDPLTILENVSVTLQPSWPINILLNQSTLEKYGRIFSLLLQLKYALHVCEQYWCKSTQNFFASQRKNKNCVRKTGSDNVKIQQDGRKNIGLFHKIAHVTRCFHEHCMVSTAGYPPANFFVDVKEDCSQHLQANQGLKGIISKHDKYIEKMLKRCIFLCQDELLFSYMKSLLSNGIKILLFLNKSEPSEGSGPAYERQIHELESQWNQNVKYLIIALEHMKVSMGNELSFEELLTRLNLNENLSFSF